MVREAEVMAAFDAWVDGFAAFVAQKGKVEPGEYRAYGHKPMGHLWKDAKLKWREVKIGLGRPPEGSSPAKQQELDLMRDETLSPKKSEGKKLRE